MIAETIHINNIIDILKLMYFYTKFSNLVQKVIFTLKNAMTVINKILNFQYCNFYKKNIEIVLFDETCFHLI